MMLEIGQSLELQHEVGPADLASSLSSSDAFPDVFATSRMIALMELVSARLMADELPPGALSAGVGVAIHHLAATPAGERVCVTSRYEGREGKLYRFHVEASDRGGLVGEGSHTRAVIDTDRLLAGAKARIDKACPPDG